jgi:Flp pilus assembly protein CpaB
MAAVICAAVAVAVIAYAINRYRSSVSTSNQEATVLVASSLIQKGTSAEAIAAGKFFIPTQVLQKQVTVGAIADAAALRGKVAATDILPGQQLTAADFVAAGGITSELATTQRAIAVPVDQPHGLTGVLAAGDRVDVYGSYQVQNKLEAQLGTNYVVRLLGSNVLVLQGPSGATGGLGAQQQTVVLSAVPRLAAELALTADYGKVWLDLRPGNGSLTPPAESATINSILSTLAVNGGTTTGANP